MSLRKGISLTPGEVLEANEELLWAVDTEDEAKIRAICDGSHLPNQDGVNRAFMLAVDRSFEPIIRLFTSMNIDALKPEQRCIDAALSDLADEGKHVTLIAMLQELASWKELQELHRYINTKRKDGNRWPYLVTMTEPNTMEEIHARQEKHRVLMTKPMNAKKMFEVIMTDQRWINRTFFDAVHSHLKLTVLHLLTVPEGDAHILKPDQTTINDSFTFSVHKGYLSMAQMLMQPPHPASLGVNQQGFDQAVQVALEDGCDPAVCGWLLNGRCGFTPSQSVLDEVYINHARLISPERRAAIGAPQVVNFGDQIARGMAQGRMNFRFNLPFRRRLTPRQRQERQEFMESQTLVTFVTSRASEEARQTIEREYARAEARQRAMQMFRTRQQGVDIHSFSHTTVGGDGAALGVAVDDEDGEMDVEDADADDADEAEGEPAEEDAAVAEPGPVAAGVVANPWEAPPRRARAPTNRPLSVHDAVVQNLQRRAGQQALTPAQINQYMGELIEANFTSQSAQADTMRIVSEGMSDENFRVLGLALQFLHTHHPHALGMWVQGFLAESIAVNSCRAGAMERIITGLRGVEDVELQQIFAQAEGPNLARIFLTGTFNIYFSPGDERSVATARQNATHLALVLVDAGVDANTPVEEVTRHLGEYARRRVAEYGVRVEGRQAQEIDNVVETVGDGYEDYLLPYVREELQRRSERAPAEQVEASNAAPMEIEGGDAEAADHLTPAPMSESSQRA